MRYRFGTFVLDCDTHELHESDREVPLEPQVYGVLAHLVEHRARVVTKEELLDAVWGSRFVSESALTTRIKQVRQAVGDNGREQRVVKTVHGRGFRFVAPLTDEAPVPRPPGPPPAPAPAPGSARSAGGTLQQPRTHWADSDGVSIAYQTFGEGPDLVFVAGFVTNVEVQWEHPDIAAFLHRLGSFARVTILDKRGVGLSDRIPNDNPPPLETRADDLRAVMDHAGVERAAVLGSSEGGSLAVLFAASHPERVDKLVLHNTWARTGWLTSTAPDYDRVTRSWGSGSLYRLLGPSLGADDDGRRVLAKLERQSATPLTARRLLELIGQIDVTGALASVTVPTVVVHRVGDPVISVEQGRILAGGIPGARLVALEGSDHWIFSGDTAPLLDEIERFVTAREPTPRGGERFLATVLFADIAASTATALRLGDVEWARLLDRFYTEARDVVAAHRGELVKTTGDGFMATFDGPGRAVQAACRARERARALSLPIRAGLHTAEVERLDGDVCGIGVNIASRVADRAEPETIWVSRTVTDLVAGTGLTFRDRGEHALKGLDRPWSLFEVVV